MGSGAGIFWSHLWAGVCRYFPFSAETKMNFLFAQAYSSTSSSRICIIELLRLNGD